MSLVLRQGLSLLDEHFWNGSTRTNTTCGCWKTLNKNKTRKRSQRIFDHFADTRDSIAHLHNEAAMSQKLRIYQRDAGSLIRDSSPSPSDVSGLFSFSLVKVSETKKLAMIEETEVSLVRQFWETSENIRKCELLHNLSPVISRRAPSLYESSHNQQGSLLAQMGVGRLWRHNVSGICRQGHRLFLHIPLCFRPLNVDFNNKTHPVLQNWLFIT